MTSTVESMAQAVAARHPECRKLTAPCKVDCPCWFEAEAHARAVAQAVAGVVGPCARRVVTCTLVTPEGLRFVGTNWCRNAQPVCPRTEGEGYEKCQTICQQGGHAEEDAVMTAGPLARGAHAYVENHTYACRNCQETLFAAGVAALTIGPPPENV